MTKKDIVEELKKDMPNFEDNNDKQIKIALYIYIRLGQMKSFDERYYFGNSQTRTKIYRLAQGEKRDIDKLAKKKKLICVGFASLYKGLLEEFGIRADIERPDESDRHELTLVSPDIGCTIQTDLQEDLHNIKTKRRLKSFGSEKNNTSRHFKVISQEKLDQMCEEVGYIGPDHDFLDNAIEELEKKIEGMGPHEMLYNILNDDRINGIEGLSDYELYRYYDSIFRTLISKKILHIGSKISYFPCYKEIEDSDEKKREYTICAYSVEKDHVKAYMYSKRSSRFLPVDLKAIKQLQEDGLVLGVNTKDKGVNFLKKHIDREMIEDIEL